MRHENPLPLFLIAKSDIENSQRTLGAEVFFIRRERISPLWKENWNVSSTLKVQIYTKKVSKYFKLSSFVFDLDSGSKFVLSFSRINFAEKIESNIEIGVIWAADLQNINGGSLHEHAQHLKGSLEI